MTTRKSLQWRANVALLACAASWCGWSAAQLAASETVRFTGAMVYDGTGFARRDLLIRRGVVVQEATPGESVREVNAAGRFLLPAFGDAHTHRFTESDPEAAELYLSHGFAYLFNLNGCVESRELARKDANTPTTPEVRFALAGFTTAGGHPQPLYTWIDGMNKQHDPATVLDRISGYNFFVTDSIADIDAKWPRLLIRRPDVIKLFLLHSERWADAGSGKKSDGLRPELALELARRAKAAGARLAAHVESLADAELAFRAGVDLLGHLPGYGLQAQDDPAEYTASDAQIAAAVASGAHLTPTLGLLYVKPEDAAGVDRVVLWKRLQVRRWRDAGVPMLYGSDNYYKIDGELKAMADSNIWSNAQLVHLLAVDTPQWILPGRRVGSLEQGSEGTLVVLGGDPVKDIKSLSDVCAVYKFGRCIWSNPPAPQQP